MTIFTIVLKLACKSFIQVSIRLQLQGAYFFGFWSMPRRMGLILLFTIPSITFVVLPLCFSLSVPRGLLLTIMSQRKIVLLGVVLLEPLQHLMVLHVGG